MNLSISRKLLLGYLRALNNGSFQINRGFPHFFRVSHFDSGR
jgi:hypothetical protein